MRSLSKPFTMAKLQLLHLQNESDAWKRQLAYMTDETINLKNRISEVLKDVDNKEIVNSLETYQTCLLEEDELILFLRNDIREYERMLYQGRFEDFGLENKYRHRTHELRRSIRLATEKFETLKAGFYSYLTEAIA